jgi:hypothetical protein
MDGLLTRCAYLCVMNSSLGPEERQHPRYAVRCEASAQELTASGLPSQDGALQGEILNISQGGFCLILKRPCTVSSVLRCEIRFPGVPVFIPTIAHVRWSQETPEGVYAIGAQYLLQ